MDVAAKLDELAAAGELHGFTIWPCRDGYQVNIALRPNAWRIRTAATPGEGIVEVLDMAGPDELTIDDAEIELLTPPAVDEPELTHDEPGIFD